MNQTGFDLNIASGNAGADYRVQDDLLEGLATGYSYTGRHLPRLRRMAPGCAGNFNHP